MPSHISLPAPMPGHSRRDKAPVPDASWLLRQTEQICTLTYRSACDTIRIGQLLEEARQRLKHGAYLKWVEEELPFSFQTAHRYRQVALAFAAFQSSQFEMFDTSALYVLAQLTTPPAAREHAVSLASEGKRITHALSLEILDAHRPLPAEPEEDEEDDEGEYRIFRCLGMVTEEATKERVQCPVEFLTTAGLRFCPKCRAAREESGYVKPTAPELLAKRWHVLEELMGGCTEVRIARVEDSECEDVLYSVTCHRLDDRPHNTVRRELYDALAVAAGKEETRYCSGYKPLYPDGHDITIGLFGKNDNNPDGLMYRCKICEKARRARMRRENRALREAQKEREVPPPASGDASGSAPIV